MAVVLLDHPRDNTGQDDIDLAALQTTNDIESIRQDVIAIAGTLLPADLDDGLIFDLNDVTLR